MDREMHYGSLPQTIINSDIERHLEELKIIGYTIIPDLLDQTETALLANKVLEIYKNLEKEYGLNYLCGIKEANLLRCPIVHDEVFAKLLSHPKIMEIMTIILGESFLLNLQNAIINTSDTIHHQRSWHRDLPYQNFIISRPISMNFMFCATDFNEITGATELIPYSHNLEIMPSEEYCKEHQIQASASAGSAVIFNSMLIHRAGLNRSGQRRIGINHIYTIPLLKQQINLAKALEGKYSNNPLLARLLDYQFQVPESDRAWKEKQDRKIHHNAKI